MNLRADPWLLALSLLQSTLLGVVMRGAWQRTQALMHEPRRQPAMAWVALCGPVIGTAIWSAQWTLVSSLDIGLPLVMTTANALKAWLALTAVTTGMFMLAWLKPQRAPEQQQALGLVTSVSLALAMVLTLSFWLHHLMLAPAGHIPVLATLALVLVAAAGGVMSDHQVNRPLKGGLLHGALLGIVSVGLAGLVHWPQHLYYVGARNAAPMSQLTLVFALSSLSSMAYVWLKVYLAQLQARTERMPMPSDTPDDALVSRRTAMLIEQLAAEKARNDKIYAQVLQHSQMCFWNLDTRTLDFSLEGKILLDGVEHTVHVKDNFKTWSAEYMDDSARATIWADVQQQIDKHASFDVTHRVRTHPAEDRWRWVISRGAVAQRDKFQRAVKLVGTHVDITAYTDLQRALDNDKRLFHDGPVVMARWQFDRSSGELMNIEFLSPNAEKLWGYTLEEIMMEQVWRQMIDAAPLRYLADLLRGISQKDSTELSQEFKLKLRSGRQAWQSFFGRVEIIDGKGYLNSFVFDIDNFKQQEDRAKQQAQQLEALVAELERARAENTILRESSEFLNSAEGLDEAFEVISRAAQAIFPQWSGALASTVDNDRLSLVGRWGDAQAFLSDYSNADCWSLRRGRTHVFQDEKVNLRCRHVHVQDPATIRPYLCIPMQANGETVGSLHLMGPGPQTKAQVIDHAERANRLGETLKLALSNLRLRAGLREQATHDGLTGLYNRRFMDDRLPIEIKRCQREGHRVTVAMIDIDHFKRLNDQFGHDAGDMVLRAVGKLLQQRIRVYDLACRYGGEEMTLIMPGCTLADALPKVEALREAIAALALTYDGDPMPTVTVSIGLADALGGAANNLLRRADEALYQAKHAGRNQVVVAPEDESTSTTNTAIASSAPLHGTLH